MLDLFAYEGLFIKVVMQGGGKAKRDGWAQGPGHKGLTEGEGVKKIQNCVTSFMLTLESRAYLGWDKVFLGHLTLAKSLKN